MGNGRQNNNILTMANDKKTIKYDYSEINQDYRNNLEEKRKLLQYWIDSPESEYRTRIIKELNEELGNN